MNSAAKWAFFCTLLAVFGYIAYAQLNNVTAPQMIPAEETSSVSFEVYQGILAGLVALAGLLLIHKLPRKWQWWGGAGLILLVTPLAIGGFWFSTGQYGISDWDYYFPYHNALRTIVLQYHEFPFWNPYTCGGTAGLADPEFSLLTPLFQLQLLFGTPTGLKLTIFASTAFGAIGMMLLGKSFGLRPAAALLAAFGFAFSSVNLLEIVEGHPNIFSAMYLPWIFWAWHRAYASEKIQKQRNWTLITGAFLALTFYQGGIYLLMYTALAFAFIIIAVPQRFKALKITTIAGLWALGLAAVKLIPAIFWLQEFQDEVYASSAYTTAWLHKIFLGRYLHNYEEIIPAQGGGWHEYGAYIGPVILSLAFLSLARIRSSRVIRYLWIGGLLALALSSSGPLLKPFFDNASWFPRSNISRVVIFSVGSAGLLAGFGLQYLINKKSKKILLFAPLLAGLAAIDLMSLSYPLSQQAFTLPPVVPAPAPAPAPISYTVKNYKYRHQGVDFTRAWAAAQAGYGTLHYCSVLTPPQAVNAVEHGEHDYLTMSRPDASARLISWSPNRIEVETETQEQAELIINANYARGWQVNEEPAREIGNRLGAKVPPGKHVLAFQYRAPGFTAGFIITVITTASALLLLARRRSHST